jgi:hypothetical protein
VTARDVLPDTARIHGPTYPQALARRLDVANVLLGTRQYDEAVATARRTGRLRTPVTEYIAAGALDTRHGPVANPPRPRGR